MIRRVLGTVALALLAGATGTPAQDGAREGPPVLEVTALEYEFRTTTTEIPAGWTTVELENRGEETHMLEFLRLPDEATYSRLRRFLGVLDTLQARLEEGAIDSARYRTAVKSEAPSWASDPEARSGPGLVTPGRTARTTVRLEPGTYVMACFLVDSAGELHYMRGMRSKMTVTEASSGASPPEADVALTLADYEMSVDGRMTTGEQTVAVHFGEREKPQEAPYQDIRLARLEEGVSVKELVQWDGSPPAPAELLGGAHPLPAGSTAYFTVNLEPGRYAWYSHSSDEKGMTKTFSVP